MTNNFTSQTWLDLVETSLDALSTASVARQNEQVRAEGLPHNWHLLWFVREFEPEPTTAASFGIQNPYSHPAAMQKGLQSLAEQGLLDEVAQGAYRLSETGQAKLGAVLTVLDEAVAALKTLDLAELTRLDELVGQWVAAAVGAEHISERRSLLRNRNSHPVGEAHPLNHLFQYFTDIQTFRDDAHLSAWRGVHEVDGAAWETLTLVWRKEATTAAELNEKLARRGHSEATYQAALDQLVALDWVEEVRGAYQVTATGQAIRDEAEARTDAYFMYPFEVLGDAQTAELYDLLGRFAEVAKVKALHQLKLAIWGTLQTLSGALTPHYQYVSTPHLRAAGLLGPQFTASLHGYAFPQFTHEHWTHRVAFAHPDQTIQTLNQAVDGGFLEVVDGQYQLTAKGRADVGEFFRLSYATMDSVDVADLTGVTTDDLQTLADLMGGIIAATAAHPIEKLSFELSRAADLGEAMGNLARIDQYVTDLLFYRDDAHNAVWRDLGISAPTWNAFSQVWASNANTAEAIAELLQGRGYDVATYRAGLAELVERGWLTDSAGVYTLTPAGQVVRDEAEIATDHNFFIGWADLDLAALNKIDHIAHLLADALRQLAIRQTWQWMRDVTNAYTPLYTPATQPYLAEAGYQGADYFNSLVTWGLEPHPMTAEFMDNHLTPYRNPAQFATQVAESMERGFIQPHHDGYTITEHGRKVIRGFYQTAYDYIDTLETLPSDRLELLLGWLNKIVDGTLAQPFNPFFRISRVTDVGHGLNAKIDQALTDFLRWRDDAHIAAWQEYDVRGMVWEAFTFIWREEATSPTALAERLAHRGYTADDYAEAIADLEARGWVQGNDAEGYTVTEAGRTVREAVETATDTIFYAPWASMTAAELSGFKGILMQMHDRLTALAPATEGA